MPTDEERREVAARLRNAAEHGVSLWGTSACCIAECLGEDDYRLWSGSEKLFILLADLIEPEPERTCRMEQSFAEPSRLDFMQEYLCLSCKEYGYMQIAVDGDRLNYCPNCGAKVVRE